MPMLLGQARICEALELKNTRRVDVIRLGKEQAGSHVLIELKSWRGEEEIRICERRFVACPE
jgi:hypothetical protein